MRWGLYKWAKWIKASHSTAMCADQKKRERKKETRGKIRGKNKSMSWIIQWLGCTPKVSALWPLWQEVKGRAVAAGINEADMFRYGPESVGEWQRKLTHLKKNSNSYTLLTHLPLVCFNVTCINCSRSLCKMWPLNPDSQNESFSLLFQQHVPSYYKIHV